MPTPIYAVVFDAYGTLFDVHSAMAAQRTALGDNADAVSALWRTKQLEYSWLRALMGKYRDFWEITRDALTYSFQAFGIEDAALFEALIEAYNRLEVYNDVPHTLEALKEHEIPAAILTNAPLKMVNAAVTHAGIAHLLTAVLSVDVIQIYKPAPPVYQLAVDRLQTEPQHILFVSANGWDIAGAAHFGFQTAWINRANAPTDRLSVTPTVEIGYVERIIELSVEGELGLF